MIKADGADGIVGDSQAPTANGVGLFDNGPVSLCAAGSGGGGGSGIYQGMPGGGAAQRGGNPGHPGGDGLDFGGYQWSTLIPGSGTTLTDDFGTLLHCGGGGGGSGGPPNSSGTYGSGGKGANSIYLECGALDHTGVISARGGNAVDGTGSLQGGSGGGGGGVILVRTKRIINNAGSVDVGGGLGAIGSIVGSGGGKGGSGFWDVVVIP